MHEFKACDVLEALYLWNSENISEGIFIQYMSSNLETNHKIGGAEIIWYYTYPSEHKIVHWKFFGTICIAHTLSTLKYDQMHRLHLAWPIIKEC